jgi:hypothetical protein
MNNDDDPEAVLKKLDEMYHQIEAKKLADSEAKLSAADKVRTHLREVERAAQEAQERIKKMNFTFTRSETSVTEEAPVRPATRAYSSEYKPSWSYNDEDLAYPTPPSYGYDEPPAPVRSEDLKQPVDPDDLQKNAVVIGGSHDGEIHPWNDNVRRKGLYLYPKNSKANPAEVLPEVYQAVILTDKATRKSFPTFMLKEMCQSQGLVPMINKNGFSI